MLIILFLKNIQSIYILVHSKNMGCVPIYYSIYYFYLLFITDLLPVSLFITAYLLPIYYLLFLPLACVYYGVNMENYPHLSFMYSVVSLLSNGLVWLPLLTYNSFLPSRCTQTGDGLGWIVTMQMSFPSFEAKRTPTR